MGCGLPCSFKTGGDPRSFHRVVHGQRDLDPTRGRAGGAWLGGDIGRELDRALVELDDGANWGVTTGVSDMYAKTANWTFTSGASTTLTFYGTKVWLYAAKAFDQAIMSLSLDGSTAATIDNLPVLVIVNVCVPRVSKGE